MSKTRSFRAEQLKNWEIPYLGGAGSFDDGPTVHEWKFECESRWDNHYSAVFTPPGEEQAYRVYWTRGATEYQDVGVWDGESEVEATLVYPHSVTVTEWRDEA